jgi:hypothetical protein
MGRVVLLSLFFFCAVASQNSIDQRSLKITEGRYRLGNYEIVIVQKKRLDNLDQKQIDSGVRPVWCSASVAIEENGKIIDKLEFGDISPLGWRYGIHLPIKQESSKHFILMKYGDYDSRVLVITDKGKQFNLGGEGYRIFLNRYLIARGGMADSSYDFSIFDLHENKLLLTVSWGDPIKVIQPSPSNGKAHIIKLYTNGPELFASIDIVDEHSLRTIEHTNHFYRIDLETGKIADAVFDEKKHTEYVIDWSNIDLSGDCECRK